MAPTISATSPSAVFGNTTATTSLVTASFTPPAGAILVAKVSSADGGQFHNSITGGSLTWTKRLDIGTTNSSSRVSIWTATVGTSAAMTVTAAFGGSAIPRSLSVNVWTGAKLASTPATTALDGTTANSPASATITTVAAGSIVDWLTNDWAAVDGTSRAYRSSATERTYQFVSGQHTVYGAWQSAASAGSQTFGLTAPTGQKPTMGAIEVQDSATVAVTPRRSVSRMQAVNRSNSF